MLRLAETVRRADVPVWLMLDDVHVIQSAGAVRALDLLLQWAPANLHVVLAARSDPRVSLGRLRLQERLVEIRDAELRLDEEETAHGCSRPTDCDLQPTMSTGSGRSPRDGWRASPWRR